MALTKFKKPLKDILGLYWERMTVTGWFWLEGYIYYMNPWDNESKCNSLLGSYQFKIIALFSLNNMVFCFMVMSSR